MTVVEFPGPGARQAPQDDNLTTTLIKAGFEPEMARAVSESVKARFAAYQAPNITAGMPLTDFAAALVAPLLLEIVRLETLLRRADETLAAVKPKRRSDVR